jgi:hypothetical protein
MSSIVRAASGAVYASSSYVPHPYQKQEGETLIAIIAFGHRAFGTGMFERIMVGLPIITKGSNRGIGG